MASVHFFGEDQSFSGTSPEAQTAYNILEGYTQAFINFGYSEQEARHMAGSYVSAMYLLGGITAIKASPALTKQFGVDIAKKPMPPSNQGGVTPIVKPNTGVKENVGVPTATANNKLSPVQQYDAYGNEIVYRTMSPEQFKQFERTGIMPATTETSVSPVLGYSSKYNGVTVKISVKQGTFSELEKIGISANEATTKEFPNMSTQTGSWMGTNTRFKVEKGQMTTQLGQGKGIDIFNKNIVHYEKVE